MEIVNTYSEAFHGIPNIQTPLEMAECDSNFHLYIVLFDFEKIGLDRAQFILELRSKDIQTQVHYIPVYFHPYYQKQFKIKLGECPLAESYYSRCLSIPLFPTMTDEEIQYVIREIKRIAAP